MTSDVYSIRYYVTADGRKPFAEWVSALRDRDSVGRIQIRLDRLRFGNRGDARSLRHGLWELRVDAGPGYRVYFTYEGKAMVLLLCAGDKSTQKRDIRRAREFLEDYLRRSDA